MSNEESLEIVKKYSIVELKIDGKVVFTSKNIEENNSKTDSDIRLMIQKPV